MGATSCVYRQPDACQSHQVAGAAFFAYSETDWDAIKSVIRDALGFDADQIELEKTIVIHHHSGLEENFPGMDPLRVRIEIAAGLYHLHSASARQSQRRVELIAQRQDIGTLRAGIIDALAVQVGTKYSDVAHPFLRPGVDADMVILTRNYFWRLARNLDRQIEQAGRREGNARKPDRDQCWNDLLAIWCELGGKPSGAATARFLKAASKPVMGSAIPTFTSVVQWLDRRQNKVAETVAKPVLRRAAR
jgi:hypothetical protein